MTLHYAGALRVMHGDFVMHILPGWAACCSGDRAVRIREEGRHTYARDAVTCRACRKLIEREEKPNA